MMQNDHDIIERIAEHPVNGHEVRYAASPSPYEVRSEEVQDIMSKMPHWIIRRGTTVLFVVVALLLGGAYFIHYPDVIVTGVNITSSNPPVKIVAQSDGKIQRMFVQDNDMLKKDENICLLENAANYQDILLLKNTLSKLDTALNLVQAIKTTSINRYMQLGELQAGYADLYQSVNQYRFFIEKNFALQKVGQIQSQMAYQHQLNKELQNKDVLLQQQLTLERKRFLADSSLVTDKIIAPLEFDDMKKELITRQMNADETKTGILQNKLQQTEFLKTITDLQQQKLQQENDLHQKIKENVKRLQGQLGLWEQKYLIKSPTEGKAAFFKFWKENQYVMSGEAVLMIVPPVQSYIAKSSLPVMGAGKVKAGQKVYIKLFSYPFEEFGMIKGKVRSVSTVAFDTAYSMEIQLANGLITTSNKQIQPQPQLSGVAEVITSDKSILERLFEKMWIKNKE